MASQIMVPLRERLCMVTVKASEYKKGLQGDGLDVSGTLGKRLHRQQSDLLRQNFTVSVQWCW